MTWQDRTRDAAYVSPSGQRFPFTFDNVDRSFEKNTTAYNFPGTRGTFVQDLGSTDRRYPMRVIFWGDDHDLEAAAFETALRETGRGKLEHPRDGQVDVVPFGTVTIREDLVNGANQTIFEVEFWESTSVLFPSGAADPAVATLNSANATFASAAATFADTIDLALPTEIVTLRNQITTRVGQISSAFQPIVNQDESVAREFNAIVDSINQNLDTLASNPGAIADQISTLLKTPSKIPNSVSDQLNTYDTVITGITGGDDPVRNTNNEFRADELVSIGCVAGSITSAVKGNFETRTLAISAASSIADQFDNVNTWRELNYG